MQLSNSLASRNGILPPAKEIVPIPPVLGPQSPSSRRLKSFTKGKCVITPFHESVIQLNSSPSNFSSNRMRSCFSNKPFTITLASSFVLKWSSNTKTPLPAANPSALITRLVNIILSKFVSLVRTSYCGLRYSKPTRDKNCRQYNLLVSK